ncbi:MAG: PglD-related sugar-binding protein, partial [Planctomycetota bacterium]
MSDRPLIVYGAGGHGLVVADAAMRSGREVLGFLDDAVERDTLVGGLPVLAEGYDEAVCNGADVIVAVGENATRLMILDRIIEAGAS